MCIRASCVREKGAHTNYRLRPDNEPVDTAASLAPILLIAAAILLLRNSFLGISLGAHGWGFPMSDYRSAELGFREGALAGIDGLHADSIVFGSERDSKGGMGA